MNKSCQHKKKEKQGQRKNVYKPSPFKKGTRIYSDNNYNRFKNHQNYSIGGEIKSVKVNSIGFNNIVKFWVVMDPMWELYKNDNKVPNVNNLQEASTVNDVVRNIPRINVTLEDRQENHQYTMLEVEGKILDIDVSILIDYGASLSYIGPQIVEK